ncbi:NADH dehydrogenase [ubiquinone] 1 alpha subcomplex assembly factor 2 isoform X2 [Equus asinus]|uniref:NADH dehydrogenase [ubiquinone] 1 alpha subcomplex assembly factor 2 isoform X2 n=1 Tax=Equus asinus TaxID=9793 RepID=UPI001D053324|nr:NADH dehydrogenase [ubiquinone] 1 alpha subcomplex assembly factor 2 isoform X2 [Equus asinus]
MGGAGGWGVPARVAADRAVTGAGSWAAGMGWSQDLFRALCRALSKDVKEQVGTDRFGNKYYCIPEYKNWRGHTVRERRIVEAANKREVDYEVGDIPTEWEAWIRRTRKTPPTMETSFGLKLQHQLFHGSPACQPTMKIWTCQPPQYPSCSYRHRWSLTTALLSSFSLLLGRCGMGCLWGTNLEILRRLAQNWPTRSWELASQKFI